MSSHATIYINIEIQKSVINPKVYNGNEVKFKKQETRG